eukprot:TRINITY_DN86616_c0_g1_i1.p1 TRINITY_DN86616_c0_g1~~TRINITY_DN86616_c0_g1_i1.p1  ORF type:complete len:390 (+),score=-2.37 TRINITY_DN86616_c0_g1_i1:337-1506(+)
MVLSECSGLFSKVTKLCWDRDDAQISPTFTEQLFKFSTTFPNLLSLKIFRDDHWWDSKTIATLCEQLKNCPKLEKLAFTCWHRGNGSSLLSGKNMDLNCLHGLKLKKLELDGWDMAFEDFCTLLYKQKGLRKLIHSGALMCGDEKSPSEFTVTSAEVDWFFEHVLPHLKHLDLPIADYPKQRTDTLPPRIELLRALKTVEHLVYERPWRKKERTKLNDAEVEQLRHFRSLQLVKMPVDIFTPTTFATWLNTLSPTVHTLHLEGKPSMDLFTHNYGNIHCPNIDYLRIQWDEDIPMVTDIVIQRVCRWFPRLEAISVNGSYGNEIYTPAIAYHIAKLPRLRAFGNTSLGDVQPFIEWYIQHWQDTLERADPVPMNPYAGKLDYFCGCCVC